MWKLGSTVAASGLVLAIACGVAHATPPGPSGYVELYGQGAWETPPAGFNPWWGGGAAGRGTFWLQPGWSVQVDASADAVTSNGFTLPNETGVAHLSYRNARGLFGAFGGVAITNDYAGTGTDTYVIGGLEGQLYLGNVTLYGQAGAARQVTGYYGGGGGGGYAANTDTFVRATLRYFPQPNTKIEGAIGLVDGSVWGVGYPGDNISAVTLAGEIEHQLANEPISAFVRVSGISDTQNGTGALSQYAVTGGIRVRLGQFKSLQDEDRLGTTLKAPDMSAMGWERWSYY